ncbi:MAG: N-acetylmuramoyl-L-alanine amidase [Deltaproteobacteria bacterium]|nr:N-acetylmuramoyl-L-alanine amidase [Deltaproteobacteria bacterium]
MRRLVLLALSLAACGTRTPVDTSRAAAFADASAGYDVPQSWLMAIGFQQGRFEPAEVVDTDPIATDPDGALMADTAVDETDDTPDAIDARDSNEPVRAWGLMYLTDDQIAQAAALTGLAPDDLRTEHAANIEGAAALLAGPDLRAQTTAFLGVDGEAADLALKDLDGVLRDGFDVTTEDGEHLALQGTSPIDAEIDETFDDAGNTAGVIERAGQYPARQWIRSPNFGSRLGSPIRYIVIHDMEGTMPGAIQVFKNPANQTSAHYLVRSRDGHIVQMVHEGDNAWHSGHGWFNRHSIGIEHEGFANRRRGGGYYNATLYKASAKLSCAIAVRYHIPVDRKHIFGHMNVPSNLASHTLCSDARGIRGACGGVNHHSDPGRYWDWRTYMHEVATCVAAAR